jgi:hypothetical protein
MLIIFQPPLSPFFAKEGTLKRLIWLKIYDYDPR